MKTNSIKATLAKEYKHNRPLTCCHWDKKSRFVFFGAEDHLIHRYDVSSGKAVPMAGHDSWVRSFASSSDGKLLYSGGYDGQIGVWQVDAENPKASRFIQAHDGWVRAVTCSEDGKYLGTCGNDKVVKLWSVSDGKLLQVFNGHKEHVYNLAFSRDSKSIVSCDLKGAVKLWSIGSHKHRDLETAKALHGYDTTFRADIGGARGIGVHTNGSQVAFSGISKVTNAFAGVGEIVVTLVNLKTGKVDRVLQSKDKTGGTSWGVSHHPAGYWIGLTGGRGGGWLFFWKGDADHEFAKVKLKNDGRGMSVSTDFKQIAVAHADSHLRTYTLG